MATCPPLEQEAACRLPRCEADTPIILVGTYRPEQMDRWILPKGLYNYPVRQGDTAIQKNAPLVSELWLYAGKIDKRRFSAKLEKRITAAELDAMGYPAGMGKHHGEEYLLFRVKESSHRGTEARREGACPGALPLQVSASPRLCVEKTASGRASRPSEPRVLVRLEDFEHDEKELKAKLAKLFGGAKAPKAEVSEKPFTYLDCLPDDLVEDWPGNLCLCEAAEQLDFSSELFRNTGDTVMEICQSVGASVNTPGWPDDFGRKLRNAFQSFGNRPVRTLSLFSGAGGLDIGFSDAGFKIVESVEIEEKFCRTLELNSGSGKRFEDSKVNCIDIRKFSASGLGHVDFIIGGPPCQTFSAAGRRANGVLGTTDSRGVLFREYVRILKELSPRGFLFENVYGITGAQNGAAWLEIQKAFREAGYRLFFRILDAADYGVPQHRERLIIVGLRSGDFRFPRPTHGPDSIDNTPFYNAGTAVSEVPLTPEESRPGLGGRFGHLLPAIPPGLNYSFYTEKLGHPKPIFAWRSKFSDFLYKADPSAPVRTIKASGGAYTGPLHWNNRFFSIGEYKRLQTFPDNYAISGGKQVAVKQIGNSVPPQLARMLAIAIQQQVFHALLPFRLNLLDEGEILSFRKRKNELTRMFRGKARNAIAAEGPTSPRPLMPESYECTLSSEFKFEKTETGTGDFTVSFRPENGIRVCDSHPDGTEKNAPSMLIRVAPSDGGWPLGLDYMDISVFSKRELAFTIGWKAFEQLLADSSMKADLVQLNGYYQYEPKLRCSCVFSGSFPFQNIVSGIVEGRNVARLSTTEQLATDWKVPPETVWDAAEFLRSIGYEVRNTNTNPQIPKGHWLIPYAFPTFTQRSVQLHKKLR